MTINPPVVAVIGTGFGGLACGTNLKHALVLNNFVIIEKSNGIGGTWRNQRYPGAAVDVAAHYYSLGFELNPNWSTEYSPRAEIRAYMSHVFDKYQLGENTRFNTEIVEVRWNEKELLWDIHVKEYPAPTTEEEKYRDENLGQWSSSWTRTPIKEEVVKANLIFNASGAFTKPYVPDYPGVDTYKGQYIHCVEWDDKIPLENKRIAIVGSGPTAIQVVSQIADKVAKLDIYQRTKNWIMPNPNVPFSEEQKQIWRTDYEALKAKRQALIDAGAQTWVMIEDPTSEAANTLKQVVIANYHKIVTKPGVIPLITPDYPIGCKRILVDCGYLVQLNRDNVELVVDPIAKFTESGIVTKDKTTGVEKDSRDYDVIIWATGWGSISFGRSFPVYGKGGLELWDYWRKAGNPRSYLGAMCHGFPNMVLGPGPSGNAFTSYIEVLEQNVDFLIKCIHELVKRNAMALEPKLEAELDWEAATVEASKSTPFAGNCISYYKFNFSAWEEAKEGGGHIGKQAEEYKEYTNPIFHPGLFGELRYYRDNADMDTFEYLGSAKWSLPEPKADFNKYRLQHKKIRDPADSPFGKALAAIKKKKAAIAVSAE